MLPSKRLTGSAEQVRSPQTSPGLLSMSMPCKSADNETSEGDFWCRSSSPPRGGLFVMHSPARANKVLRKVGRKVSLCMLSAVLHTCTESVGKKHLGAWERALDHTTCSRGGNGLESDVLLLRVHCTVHLCAGAVGTSPKSSERLVRHARARIPNDVRAREGDYFVGSRAPQTQGR